MFGLEEENCPEGTVPILRTTKYNLTQENLISNDHMLVQDIPGVHLAEVSLKRRSGPYYKVSGIMNIYNPKVNQKSQISMSHIWVEKGSVDTTNKISAGWHVHPELNSDYATHFYSTWTSDNFRKTGCYNVRCPGFVQTDRNIYLGSRFPHVSVYGVSSYEIYISITQDAETKNWWLTLGDKNIGYFPAALFVNLGSAAIVGWGGRTKANIGSPSPPMGSGHFPDGHSLNSCYFRSVFIQDSSRDIYGPKPDQTVSFTDNSKCYGVTYYGDQREFGGSVLQFGGPGGDCGK
ncbi:hypothetical protein LR48_Vigan07g074200 [Vigna angularis]|uniref:Neprosin PEP catalytic domain-containing protein n=2 Tax=Phaseolus angularis TaxID=3914 RepID=A0A0L9UWA6_PHAAN|nr:hypothetical protein LR48_Vigan07g074200 [Vigna angularis]